MGIVTDEVPTSNVEGAEVLVSSAAEMVRAFLNLFSLNCFHQT